jgi:hypothetical protein
MTWAKSVAVLTTSSSCTSTTLPKQVFSNALDVLFHEWVGKPAVARGAQGKQGSGAGVAGLRMLVVDCGVGYMIDVMDGPGVNERGGFGAEREDLWRKEGRDKRVGRASQEISKRSCAESSFTNSGQTKN